MFVALYQRDRGNLENAATILVKGLRSVRSDARIAVLQGLIYQDLNNVELAARSFRVALERDPSNSEAKAMMAYMRPWSVVSPESGYGAASNAAELAAAVNENYGLERSAVLCGDRGYQL